MCFAILPCGKNEIILAKREISNNDLFKTCAQRKRKFPVLRYISKYFLNSKFHYTHSHKWWTLGFPDDDWSICIVQCHNSLRNCTYIFPFTENVAGQSVTIISAFSRIESPCEIVGETLSKRTFWPKYGISEKELQSSWMWNQTGLWETYWLPNAGTNYWEKFNIRFN